MSEPILLSDDRILMPAQEPEPEPEQCSLHTTGSAELARRVRGYFGLMSHIARLANVTRPHVSFVVSGQRKSEPLMRIVLRQLAKAEAGEFRRAA